MSEIDELVGGYIDGAAGKAGAGTFEDPKKAARALDLSKATGVPAEAIHADVEGFEERQKLSLASAIVKDNPALQDWVTSKPLNGALANGDWHNLDKATRLADTYKSLATQRILGGAMEAFGHAFGEEPLGDWATKPIDEKAKAAYPKLSEWIENEPRFTEAAATLLTPVEIFLRSLPASLAFIAGLGGGTVAELPGFSETAGKQLTRDIFGYFLHRGGGGAGVELARARTMEYQAKLREAVVATKPWLDAGKEPPVGAHYLMDEIKGKVVDHEIKQIEELQKAVDQSELKQIAPDQLTELMRQRLPESKISIPAEVVEKIYGEKVPALDDGKLGWIPELANQLRIAKETGGDIVVRVADWVSRVDPELAKELREDIRTSPEGMTLREVKDRKWERETSAMADLPSKLEIKKGLSSKILEEEGADFGPDATRHNFIIVDETGKFSGELKLVEYDGGKKLYVDWIGGVGSQSILNQTRTDWILGPHLMLQLAKQVREMFPNAEEVSGYRVSGARDKAGTTRPITRKFDLRSDDAMVEFADELTRPNLVQELRRVYGLEQKVKGITEDLQGGLESFTPHRWTPEQTKAIEAVDKIIARISGETVRFEPVGAMATEGMNIKGLYTRWAEIKPLIQVAFEKPGEAEFSARHELGHHLRKYGFYTEQEWSLAKRVAKEEDWIGQNKRLQKEGSQEYYGEGRLLEEAIVDKFAEWAAKRDAAHPLAQLFQKLLDLLTEVKGAIREAFGREPTIEELFLKTEKGKVGAREQISPQPLPSGKMPFTSAGAELKARLDKIKEGETSAMAEPPDRPPGMTADRYKRYLKELEKQHEEDYAHELAKAKKEEKLKQTTEWKESEALIREDVTREVGNRPDVALTQAIREGKLFGEQLSVKMKLSAAALTEEQKAALPKSYYSIQGIPPNDLAGTFGFESGAQLVDSLVALEKQRGRRPIWSLVDSVINSEVDRRMKERYGDLDENILREAQDRAVSETTVNLEYEKLAALADSLSQKPPKQSEIRARAKDLFYETITGQTTEKFLREVAAAATKVEDALLKKDFQEAFVQSQRKILAMMFAREAKAYEREVERFDKFIKQHQGREHASVPQEHLNFIHDIMLRVGRPARRSVQDLAEDIASPLRTYKTLEEFYDSRNTRGLPEGFEEYGVEYTPSMPVAEFLFDQAWRKPVEEMTVGEFMAVSKTLRSIAKNGRDESRVYKKGDAYDRAVLKGQFIEQMKTLGEKTIPFNLGPVGKAQLFGKRMYAGLIQLENVFDRIDRGDPNGIFSQFLGLPMISAGNHYSTLQRQFSAMLRDTSKYDTSLREKIPNDIFKEPLSVELGLDKKPDLATGTYLPMTRGNLRVALLNAGNKSNLEKLAKGYHTTPEAVMRWLDQHATKEDWAYARAIGKIFEDIQDLTDRMTMNLHGTLIEKIPTEPIATRHGEFEGWYYPMVYDRTREGGPKGSVEPIPKFRAMTSRGFEKKRTAYTGPVDLSIDGLTDQINRRLKDIAFRPVVIEAGKFFYDKEFRGAMTKYYGSHFTDLLEPYLKDIAGQVGFKSKTVGSGERFVEGLRQNLIGVLIGWNPGTVMKHGPTALINSITEVGPSHFLKATHDLFKTNDITSEKNYTFIRYGGKIGETVWAGSEEVNRRMQHWEETIGGAQDIALGKLSLRQTLLKYGSKPVAWSDMASVLPTWLAKYRSEMEAVGGTMKLEEAHGHAVEMADRAVRRAHGSTAVTSRPELVRTGPIGRTMTSLYGFFNHIFNRYYRMSWQAKDLAENAKLGEPIAKDIADLTVQFMSYVVAPIVIEELVTPITNDQRKSWGEIAAMSVAKTVSASIPVIRDVAHAVLTGHDPSSGLITTGGKAMTDLARDVSGAFHKGRTPQRTANMIQHSFSMMGMATGLTSTQQGRWAKAFYNISQGYERPRTRKDWYQVFRYGTMKEPKH